MNKPLENVFARQSIFSLPADWPAHRRNLVLACIMALMLCFVGFLQSWNLAFSLLNMCLISAIMSLGVNIQWGYAGLFNVGIMGFAALGGVSVVLIAQQPVSEAIDTGGMKMFFALLMGVATIIAGAGGSAHLPGMVASLTSLPVIGVPVALKNLDGMDSLLSIVQMPAGVPVATVGIGNAKNAALLAARILGISNKEDLISTIF